MAEVSDNTFEWWNRTHEQVKEASPEVTWRLQLQDVLKDLIALPVHDSLESKLKYRFEDGEITDDHIMKFYEWFKSNAKHCKSFRVSFENDIGPAIVIFHE